MRNSDAQLDLSSDLPQWAAVNDLIRCFPLPLSVPSISDVYSLTTFYSSSAASQPLPPQLRVQRGDEQFVHWSHSGEAGVHGRRADYGRGPAAPGGMF